ncbi:MULTISPECIES: beta-ketoacyl synthase chain length factor [Rahnella]|uniref:Beta-ketoacyl synthase chain length factor n=1 Tax=Rahnella laticis TaxID=2787622 RepID=A0ABS0E8F6_9GAMM|nr:MULTISPECIES: beta-ketoacyl synthase chain length factor [Rahnella]MBF7981373.1 beta-ketoacyl synthase chain length factor [Rahnella laticis]MBF8001465.1 beta-ketoacyl synthase chain length factor [Rahnella sp. LAC-M12]
MKFSLDILDWQAVAPGINNCADWIQWAQCSGVDAFSGEIPKSEQIPMMAARRMSIGSRFAVDAGLSLLLKHQVDAAIFTSRHGELERTGRILHALAENDAISPTEFSMSVHNTAAGWLTIISKNPLPVTSLAAGMDSFQQGLLEAQSMLAGGASRIMLVDFDGEIPSLYAESVNSEFLPYAMAIILAAGDTLQCQRIAKNDEVDSLALPQGLQFLRGYLSSSPSFIVSADSRYHWQWARAL